MNHGRPWQVKVELMMPKEGAMLLLVHFLLTWHGNFTMFQTVIIIVAYLLLRLIKVEDIFLCVPAPFINWL